MRQTKKQRRKEGRKEECHARLVQCQIFYGLAEGLVWMQQSLSVTRRRERKKKEIEEGSRTDRKEDRKSRKKAYGRVTLRCLANAPSKPKLRSHEHLHAA